MGRQLALVLLLIPFTIAYNVDTEAVFRFFGPSGSEFGHAVSFHRSATTNMLLVGAPRASYTNAAWTTASPSGLNRTGVLYRCPWPSSLSSPTACAQLRVDTTAPLAGSGATEQPEVKSDMRMGQSVISTGPDGVIMVCASRWAKRLPCIDLREATIGTCYGNPVTTKMYTNIGKCVVLPSDLSVTGTPNNFAPLDNLYPYTAVNTAFLRNFGVGSRERSYGYGGRMTSSLGFSMSASPKTRNSRLPLTDFNFGGPEFVFGRGIWVTADLSTGSPQDVRQQSFRANPTFSSASSHATVDGYFDNSTTKQKAVGRPGVNFIYPVGCRNCEGRRGQIWIIKSGGGLTDFKSGSYPANSLAIIMSTQFGEGFAMSLLALDSDNDTIDELYVGAPYYMDFSRANEPHSYDFGAVYKYSTTLTNFLLANSVKVNYNFLSFNSSYFEGHDGAMTGQPGSRFGFSLASVGDIDKDGYLDMAVGAPGEYTADQPLGAVYIYSGSATGFGQVPSQRIVPQDTATRGFGYSLAYGWDIDSNGYSDFAVGAVHSATAFVYRARPVVTVSIWFKAVPSFDASNRSCLFAGQQRACFMTEVCAQYEGPTQATQVVVSYTLSVPRATFELLSGTSTSVTQKTMQLTAQNPNAQVCDIHTVYVRTDIPNLCTEHNLTVTQWSLVKRASTLNEVTPVLDKSQPPVTPVIQVNLLPPCSLPGCGPDLTGSFSSVGSVVSGQASTSNVAVEIRNQGNHAACSLQVELTAAADFPGVVFSAVGAGNAAWLCSALGQRSVTCTPSAASRHFGGLAPGATASLIVRIHTSQLYPASVTTHTLNVNSSSLNPETATGNNEASGKVSISRLSQLSVAIGGELLQSVSLTGSVINTVPVTSIASLPFAVTSTFQVRNAGPSASFWTDVAIKYPISRPGFTNADSYDLYYLTSVQANSPNISCNSSALINVRRYQIPTQSGSTFYPVKASSTQSASPEDVYKECTGQYCQAAIVCRIPTQAPGNVAQVRLQWSVFTTNIQAIVRASNTLSSVQLPVSVSVVATASSAGYTPTITLDTVLRNTDYFSAEEASAETTNSGIIAGVVVGCIVFILLIIIILYFLGFFKAKKPEGMERTMEWTQPGGADMEKTSSASVTPQDEADVHKTGL